MELGTQNLSKMKDCLFQTFRCVLFSNKLYRGLSIGFFIPLLPNLTEATVFHFYGCDIICLKSLLEILFKQKLGSWRGQSLVDRSKLHLLAQMRCASVISSSKSPYLDD